MKKVAANAKLKLGRKLLAMSSPQFEAYVQKRLAEMLWQAWLNEFVGGKENPRPLAGPGAPSPRPTGRSVSRARSSPP